ncbi:MAG: outer membrane receptor protein involved in Fe transport [Dokdonia sp.]|jgi:outer membrane receptor protein involved in Fe transport
MKKITLLSVITLFFMTAMSFAQGVTTSSINGRVLDNTDGPLPGATIIATHVPTGSVYGAVTDFDGFYRITNMKSGGPYNLSITYVGFQDFKKEGFGLSLGESKRISTKMVESSNALDEIVITAQNNGIFNSNKTGSETSISERDINTLPTVSRSLADFARVTPSAQLTEGNDGFSISLGGQNNRYNAIYIDGAVNNDVFGLAGSGTNGGQTGVNPFSVDAIESVQINLAPFDVRQSGFSGGSVNAVTRSGSNNWEGSVYGFYRNESLVGKTPVDLVNEGDEREKVDEFSALTYGVRVGGPIIKDKLFVFVNYERQEDETPQPFTFSNYTGNSSIEDINNLSNFLQSEYGYNPGIFDANTRTLDSDKFNLRFDLNASQNHKIYLRLGVVQAENLEARSSGNRNIGFINGSELFETNTYSAAFEWNATFGPKFANNLKIGYTRVDDDRDPAGNPFPTVDIQDGAGTLSFGAEPFSTANLLEQDIFTINNNFEIFAGRHTVTLGANLEWASAKNLFFAFNFGDYTFEDQFNDDGDLISSGLNQFLTGEVADVFQHGYSLVGDGTVGDESAGSADFGTFQAGFYVQDEVQVADNFKLTAGVRVDIPYWEDGTINSNFNTRTIPLLEAEGKDLQGARVGPNVNATAHIAPRIGFNWDVFDNNKTQVRGGVGVFTSRLPLVWPGGTYNNNGVTGGFSFLFGQVAFQPDVNQQTQVVPAGSGGVGGNIDLFAENFKLPQVSKFNIAVDQQLPIWGLVATADFTYTDVLNDIKYENLNLKGPSGSYIGADNRPYYDRRDEIDDTYGRIILASNTNEGYATNASLTIRKPFSNGFQGQVSYAYGDSKKVFDGTSSQNSSQWRGIQTVNGKNSDIPLSRSDFALGSRISANASYEIEYGGEFGGKTTIGLFYEGAQSRPYSFTYREGRDLLNDDSRDNALIYVPANASEINFSGDAAEQAQQWERLNFFIENDDYLKTRKGDYAERNGSRGPWNHVVDLKFLQDIYFKSGDKKHTLQLSIDIFNFTNLLNEEWGVRNFTRSNVQPLQTVSTSDDIPVFSFVDSILEYDADGNPTGLNTEEVDDFGLQSSRWQAQIGLRYIFN